MKIVPYDLKDGAAVAVLFREIFAEMGWHERASDHMDKPQLLFHLPDGGILLLVKENNLVIGTAGIVFLTKTEGLIKRFYLNQLHRGSGVAQKLLVELIQKAKSAGLKKLILDVSKTNTRAVRFYEKNGFKLTDITPSDRGSYSAQGWPESYQPETHFFFYKMVN